MEALVRKLNTNRSENDLGNALEHLKDASEGLRFLKGCTQYEDTSIENPGAFHTAVQTIVNASLESLRQAIEYFSEKQDQESGFKSTGSPLLDKATMENWGPKQDE